jgi:hypothetical protein
MRMWQDDTMGTCPHCGTQAALVDIGERIDHPHRWLRWSATVTHICTCSACGEVVELTEIQERGKKP